ncbi:1,4-dihydroxy-2-naphthoyl-CoA thioesterase 1 [Asparagus officinalis]|uniref:1,4-dihydroxy-2-naphthoyl-CoA thioesterase 1 n=1 Tax=Asparagus officinalis TaxID=4686 RepID=UPI00098E3086|nr:1,4-dihydroxy-2-naphthoyl-CoA thioesterase 1 [Asparagus officinalis]
MSAATPPTAATISEATAALDRPLNAIGFEYELISPQRVTGRLKVTEICCQPFGVLNGGVSAMMAESVASLGAYVASGFRRVAGAQLSTNHIKAALLGDLVQVEALPIQVGKTIQVWEVQLWKMNPSAKKILLSTSKITLVSNLPASDDMKGYEEIVRKYAKL